MIKKGLLAIGLLASLNTLAQDVNPYAPGTMEEGVVYYLPKTQIEVKVTVTHTTYTPGKLCQYANQYLKLQNISVNPNQYWKIKSFQVNPIGVPDVEKAYSIKLKEKIATSQVELTKDGIIKAINTTAPKEEKAEQEPRPSEKAKRVDPSQYMTEEILMAGSTNKMAELIAKEIYNIRESKNSLTRGQADYMPQDGTSLQIMLTNLEIQEKAMTEMFSGYTESTDHTFTFYIEPEKKDCEFIVCRFSKKLGVLENDDMAGEPIYISISNESAIPAPSTEEPKGKKIEDGIIYNIPGKGKIVIKSSGKVYHEEKFPITQFGETEILTNGLFSKKINTRVIFNPITGGISKIDKN
jgi:hypothetical protein